MSEINTKLKQLRNPFPPEDVEWRVQTAKMGKEKPYAFIVPYLTNRAIQQRLDDVFGLDWQNAYKPDPQGRGWLCGISVYHNDRWITRWDGAEESDTKNMDSLKSGMSNSMKRAAVQWGIGRYLYQFDGPVKAECKKITIRYESENNYQFVKPGNNDEFKPFHMDWKAPDLEEWALPHANMVAFIQKMRLAQTMDALEKAFNTARKAAHGDADYLEEILEAKNTLKVEMGNKNSAKYAERYNDVSLWLDAQIATMFKVPNISSVESLNKVIYNDLCLRCDQAAITDEHQVILIESLNRQFNEIKTKLQESNRGNSKPNRQ